MNSVQNNVSARMWMIDFKDTVHFKCNASIDTRDGLAFGAPFTGFNTIIDTNAVMTLDQDMYIIFKS